MNNRNKLDELFDFSDKVIEAVIFIFAMVMFTAGVLQVLFRYVFHISLSWSEELMRFIYVWITMIGASLAVRRKQFTVIEVVSNLISNKSKITGKILFYILQISQVGFFAVLTYWGYVLVLKNLRQLSPAMQFNMGIAYFALPLGGALGVIYCLISLRDFQKKTK